MAGATGDRTNPTNPYMRSSRTTFASTLSGRLTLLSALPVPLSCGFFVRLPLIQPLTDNRDHWHARQNMICRTCAFYTLQMLYQTP